MKLTTVPLKDVRQTIREMFKLIETCAEDVAPYATQTPEQFYSMVRALPYIPDPRGNEWVQRPASSLHGWGFFRDCDDKAILMAAYAKAAGIPFRIAIGGSRAYVDSRGRTEVPYHHVWPEFYMMGKWLPMDATYSRYQPYIHNQQYLRLTYFYPNTPVK